MSDTDTPFDNDKIKRGKCAMLAYRFGALVPKPCRVPLILVAIFSVAFIMTLKAGPPRTPFKPLGKSSRGVASVIEPLATSQSVTTSPSLSAIAAAINLQPVNETAETDHHDSARKNLLSVASDATEAVQMANSTYSLPTPPAAQFVLPAALPVLPVPPIVLPAPPTAQSSPPAAQSAPPAELPAPPVELPAPPAVAPTAQSPPPAAQSAPPVELPAPPAAVHPVAAVVLSRASKSPTPADVAKAVEADVAILPDGSGIERSTAWAKVQEELAPWALGADEGTGEELDVCVMGWLQCLRPTVLSLALLFVAQLWPVVLQLARAACNGKASTLC